MSLATYLDKLAVMDVREWLQYTLDTARGIPLNWLASAVQTSLGKADVANPMTTAGDTIYGGASGVPTRLSKGTTGQVLTQGASVPSWSSLSVPATLVAAQYADKAIGPSSNTETTVFAGIRGSLTIAAGALVVGSVIRITVFGKGSTKGNPAGGLTIKAKVGANTNFSQSVNQSGTLTDSPFRIVLDIVVRSVGAGGTVICNGKAFGSLWSLEANLAQAAVLSTVDTTIANDLDVTLTYATSDVANGLTVQGAMVEVL